jgi:hypothetical protein
MSPEEREAFRKEVVAQDVAMLALWDQEVASPAFNEICRHARLIADGGVPAARQQLGDAAFDAAVRRICCFVAAFGALRALKSIRDSFEDGPPPA